MFEAFRNGSVRFCPRPRCRSETYVKKKGGYSVFFVFNCRTIRQRFGIVLRSEPCLEIENFNNNHQCSFLTLAAFPLPLELCKTLISQDRTGNGNTWISKNHSNGAYRFLHCHEVVFHTHRYRTISLNSNGNLFFSHLRINGHDALGHVTSWLQVKIAHDTCMEEETDYSLEAIKDKVIIIIIGRK